MAPSCILAPPDAEITTSGDLFCKHRSMARVIFSPTTEPMLPPTKRKSMAQISVFRPATLPDAAISASLRPVAFRIAASRSL